MSLMNYGFTKSKVARLDEEEESDGNSQEIEENIEKKSKSSKSSTKSPSKSPLKSSSKVKKDSSSPSSKSSTKKDSPKVSSPKKSHKTSSTKSPKENKSNPFKKLSTPKENNSSPLKKLSTPKENNSSPLKKLSTPKENISSPFKKLSTPKNMIPSPGSSMKPNSISPKKGPADVSLPYVRIKMIMKSCPDVEMVPNESLHVITKATELFIQHLATESLKASTRSSFLDYESLSTQVHSVDNLEFLKETIPKKITWEECQKLLAAKKQNTSNEF